jgi:cellobiose phosphorylase
MSDKVDYKQVKKDIDTISAKVSLLLDFITEEYNEKHIDLINEYLDCQNSLLNLMCRDLDELQELKGLE